MKCKWSLFILLSLLFTGCGGSTREVAGITYVISGSHKSAYAKSYDWDISSQTVSLDLVQELSGATVTGIGNEEEAFHIEGASAAPDSDLEEVLFTVYVGPTIDTIVMEDRGFFEGEENGTVQFYHPVFEFAVDYANAIYSSENGVLIRNDTGEPEPSVLPLYPAEKALQ